VVLLALSFDTNPFTSPPPVHGTMVNIRERSRLIRRSLLSHLRQILGLHVKKLIVYCHLPTIAEKIHSHFQ
jgi:hypothetical protein